jgi:Uma2 family endonuclease
MSALPKRYFTPEEYLALELKAEYKSQYVAGEIFAMAGAQPEHVTLTTGIAAMLYHRFRGRPCQVYSNDLRVRVKPGNLWTYPDVAALCGEPHFDRSSDPASLLNPQVIFEVLSPSTEAFDRGDKFARYRLLESLSDYVLVSPERMRVEHFVRQGDASWRFTERRQPDDRLSLVSVDCELPLAEIYERVTFPDAGFGG